MSTLLAVILLSAVEGLTEFIPVSSTGHLIIAGMLIKDDGIMTQDFKDSFSIMCQSGAVLAVISLYFRKITEDLTRNIPKGKKTLSNLIKSLLRFRLLWQVSACFVPTAIIGLIVEETIGIQNLFSIKIVLINLVIGGLVLMYTEFLTRKTARHKASHKASHKGMHMPSLGSNGTMKSLSLSRCAALGVVQAISVLPGVSRSGSLICGGVVLGLKKEEAIDFSFLLSIPTILAAGALYAMRHHDTFAMKNTPYLIIGIVLSFLVSMFSIRLMSTITVRFGLHIFGIYRILFALITWLIVS